MTKTNVQPTPSNSQHHDTPNNKTHVIKFRVTAEEKASLELTCKLLNLYIHLCLPYVLQCKIKRTVILYLENCLSHSHLLLVRTILYYQHFYTFLSVLFRENLFYYEIIYAS